MAIDDRIFRFANGARSTLASGISASADSLQVQSGDGSLFPSFDPTYDEVASCVLWSADLTEFEVVYVTAIDSDTFEIERGKEGTTAIAFDEGATIVNTVTTGFLNQQAATIPGYFGPPDVDIVGDSIVITWEEGDPGEGNIVLGYNVYKSVNGSEYELLVSVDADTFSYEDTDVETTGNVYSYYISVDLQFGQTPITWGSPQTEDQFAPDSIFIFPLTYDEDDSEGAVSLTRPAGNGPYITPQGFRGDGEEAQYYVAVASLPAELQGSEIMLHAIITPPHRESQINVDVPGSLCVGMGETGGSAAQYRHAFFIQDDTRLGEDVPSVWYRTYSNLTQTNEQLVRRDWKFEAPFPEKSDGSFDALPQAILHRGDDILISAHFEDQYSKCYRMHPTYLTVLDTFEFGATDTHVVSFCDRTADGSYWYGDFNSSFVRRFDAEASFAAGDVVYDLSVDFSALQSVSGIEWVEDIGGQEYFLVAEFTPGGTPYLYLFAADEITNGAAPSIADRTKRLVILDDLQGIVYQPDTGYLYLSHSTNGAGGNLFVIDFDAWVTGGADGDNYATYLVDLDDRNFQLNHTPTEQAEDIDFDPDGRLWMMTEGFTGAGDDSNFLAIWSTDFHPAENLYSVYYDAAGNHDIYINGKFFGTFALSAINAGVQFNFLVIGGYRAETVGFGQGYTTSLIRGVALTVDDDLSPDTYAAMLDGDYYETEELTVVALNIQNPGGEVANSGHWTDEVGSITQRSATPDPFEGVGYWFGGANAQTISRQRFQLTTVLGLSTAQIDALIAGGDLWTHVAWQQANFTGAADPGAMGIRYLNTTPAEISVDYADLDSLGVATTWYDRSHSMEAPAASRHVDVIVRSDRTSGTNNDSDFDSIEAYVYHR